MMTLVIDHTMWSLITPCVVIEHKLRYYVATVVVNYTCTTPEWSFSLNGLVIYHTPVIIYQLPSRSTVASREECPTAESIS